MIIVSYLHKKCNKAVDLLRTFFAFLLLFIIFNHIYLFLSGNNVGISPLASGDKGYANILGRCPKPRKPLKRLDRNLKKKIIIIKSD